MPLVGLKSDNRRVRMEQDAKRMLLEYNRETKRLDDLYRCAVKQCGICLLYTSCAALSILTYYMPFSSLFSLIFRVLRFPD